MNSVSKYDTASIAPHSSTLTSCINMDLLIIIIIINYYYLLSSWQGEHARRGQPDSDSGQLEVRHPEPDERTSAERPPVSAARLRQVQRGATGGNGGVREGRLETEVSSKPSVTQLVLGKEVTIIKPVVLCKTKWCIVRATKQQPLMQEVTGLVHDGGQLC